MFFIKNPIRLNVTNDADSEQLSFLDTTLKLEYWHAAGPEAPARLHCVRSKRQSTDEELDPKLWQVEDIDRCGRLRIVKLTFLGKNFTVMLRNNGLLKRELTLAQEYVRRRKNIAPDKPERIAAERELLAKNLEQERRAATESELAVYAQYNAIVRQEPVGLWFAGSPDNQVEFRMSDKTIVKTQNLAGVTVQLNYA